MLSINLEFLVLTRTGVFHQLLTNNLHYLFTTSFTYSFTGFISPMFVIYVRKDDVFIWTQTGTNDY